MNDRSQNGLRIWAKRLLRLVALTLVGIGIWHATRKATSELSKQRQQLTIEAAELREAAEAIQDAEQRQVMLRRADQRLIAARDFWKPDWNGLALAGFLYCGSMLPAALFWRRCLVELDQVHHLGDALWAYFYGNLGKYFPGKAMVIVLRVSALANHHVKKVATVVTVFMETLSLMAVGGAVGAFCMIILDVDWRLTALALGLLLATLVPSSPPVIRFLLPRLQRGVDSQELDQWAERIHWPLFFRGWAMLSVGWLLNGLSLVVILQSLPSSELAEVPWSTLYMSATGASALAVVLGFVSLIPGGAGVRELVLSLVLAPVVGAVAALCAALWMRIVGLAGELLIVGILYVARTCGWTHRARDELQQAGA